MCGHNWIIVQPHCIACKLMFRIKLNCTIYFTQSHFTSSWLHFNFLYPCFNKFWNMFGVALATFQLLLWHIAKFRHYCFDICLIALQTFLIASQVVICCILKCLQSHFNFNEFAFNKSSKLWFNNSQLNLKLFSAVT